MMSTRPGLIAVALLSPLLLAPAAAQAQDRLPAGDSVHERLVEFGAFTGWQGLDSELDYASGAPLIGVRATINNSSRWAFEGRLAYSPGQTREVARGMLTSFSAHPVYNNQGFLAGVLVTELETNEFIEEHDSSLLIASGTMLFHVTGGRFRPFVLVGAGAIDDFSNRTEDPTAPLSDPFLEFGVGFKYLRRSGFGIRLDVTDLFTRKDNAARENPRAPLIAAQFASALLDFSSGATQNVSVEVPYSPVDYRGRRWLNNISVSISVSMPLGFAWKDGDGDHIETRFDECPSSAPGVVVDGLGCGIDTDKDGVFDGLDNCEGTPLGAFVDLGGCPSDSDADGVFDGIDVADDTPPGALVHADGQHYDTDGDGIWDGLDLCNDTPLAASINDDGCVEDPVEDSFLRGQAIVVQDIVFERGTDEIDPLSYHHVNKVARLLERWTGNDERPLRVELGVFTDGADPSDRDQRLSQRRAENIRLYLLETFFGMGANNLVAAGYGNSLPLADDSTSEGRAENDRLEIRFTEEGDPPEEYDFGAEDEEDADFLGAGTGSDAAAPVVPAVDADPLGGGETPEPDLEIPLPPEIEDLDLSEDDLDLSGDDLDLPEEPAIPER